MTARHELTLAWRDGGEQTVLAQRSKTILDAAESAGVTLPFGCRTGACASCVGLLTDGEITYTRIPRALKPRHIEAGYILCCIAQPRTDCRIEVGSDVQAELVSNPWK